MRQTAKRKRDTASEQTIGVEFLAAEIEPAEQRRMQVGNVRGAFLGGRHRDNFGQGMSQEDSDQFERRITGTPEDCDARHWLYGVRTLE
jgi:hypothetical protein